MAIIHSSGHEKKSQFKVYQGAFGRKTKIRPMDWEKLPIPTIKAFKA